MNNNHYIYIDSNFPCILRSIRISKIVGTKTNNLVSPWKIDLLVPVFPPLRLLLLPLFGPGNVLLRANLNKQRTDKWPRSTVEQSIPCHHLTYILFNFSIFISWNQKNNQKNHYKRSIFPGCITGFNSWLIFLSSKLFTDSNSLQQA